VSKERKIKATVSGSFSKFKDKIDLAIEELEDLGVEVLSPDKGWLYIPKYRVLRITESLGLRPLPSEKDMSLKQIEDEHLRSISNSDFLYVVDPDGYVGEMVSFEMGFAWAADVPVFSMEQINPNLDIDPLWKQRIKTLVRIRSIEQVVQEAKEKVEVDQDPSSKSS